jgi:type I restriction enzyme S subunit
LTSRKAQARSRWELVQLGRLATFRNGINFRSDSFGRGLRIINVADFGDRVTPDYEALTEVSESALSSQESLLADRDIVAVRSNGNRLLIGRTMLIKQPPRVTHSAFTIRIRVDKAGRNQLLPEFLAYALRGPVMRSVLSNEGHGTNISNLNQDILRRLELHLPPLAIQRKISAILSAYDDLIENNNGRIKLLGEMVQRIYREWFVDLRYPGHENVVLVDSESGPIPEGWKIGTLGDLVDVNASTIRKAEASEAIRYIDIASVTRGVVQQPRGMLLSEAPGRARRRVADGDILWSTVRPNLRAHALLLEPGSDCVASTGFAVLSPRRASFAYVYAMTTTDAFVEYLSGRASGSTYPAVTPPVFESAPAIVPSGDVLRAFADAGEPLLRLASRLGAQVDTLRATRDVLLPRLISGEVDVADLDIAMPEAAA